MPECAERAGDGTVRRPVVRMAAVMTWKRAAVGAVNSAANSAGKGAASGVESMAAIPGGQHRCVSNAVLLPWAANRHQPG